MTTGLLVLGAALVAAGMWMAQGAPAALVVAGCLCVLVGILRSDDLDPD